jgi:hypothetical protein
MLKMPNMGFAEVFDIAVVMIPDGNTRSLST